MTAAELLEAVHRGRPEIRRRLAGLDFDAGIATEDPPLVLVVDDAGDAYHARPSREGEPEVLPGVAILVLVRNVIAPVE